MRLSEEVEGALSESAENPHPTDIARLLSKEIRGQLKAKGIKASIKTRKYADEAHLTVQLTGDQMAHFDEVKKLVQAAKPESTLHVKYDVITYGDKNNSQFEREVTVRIWAVN